jgi:hypothetical protein
MSCTLQICVIETAGAPSGYAPGHQRRPRSTGLRGTVREKT